MKLPFRQKNFPNESLEATAKGSFIVVVTVSVFRRMSIALVVHRKAGLLFVFLLIAPLQK